MSLIFDLEDAINFLERTPRVLAIQLSGLSDDLLKTNEGGDSWSPHQVLGHLVYGEETDWVPRTKIILEHGVSKEFTPFDRFAQDLKYFEKTSEELLEMFSKKRAENIETLQSLGLTKKDLLKKGRHPEFGEITLREMLSAWVVHDMGHIVQINRTLAKNYRDEIGPWKKYLTIVRSNPAPEK